MSKEPTFEEAIVAAAKHSIVKLFSDGNMIAPDYANRIKVPPELTQKVYDLVDYEAVLAILRPKVIEMVADRIASALSQELTTDVKKVLSHEPTRMRLRAVVLREIDLIAHHPATGDA